MTMLMIMRMVTIMTTRMGIIIITLTTTARTIMAIIIATTRMITAPGLPACTCRA